MTKMENIGYNIYSVFENIAERKTHHTAVIYLGSCYSYKVIREYAERFASSLIAMGVKPDEKVIIYLPNSIQWVICWLGIQRAGAICVPITPIYTPQDLSYIANDSGAETIICADTNFGYVQKVLAKSELKRVIFARMTDLLPWYKRYFGRLFDVVPRGKVTQDNKTFNIRSLLRRYKNVHLPDIKDRGNSVAEILYTGGTTKFPKGVPITHRFFLVSALEQIGLSEPLIPCEKNLILGNVPLFHILGQACGLAALLAGGSLLIQPRMNLDATLDVIGRFRVRSMIGVPALYRMILEHERIDQYDLSSVDFWYCAGDVLPLEVSKRWKKKFGKSIYQGYGATETCGGVSMCPVDLDNNPRSVGQILPSKKVKIVDPSLLEPVEPGKPGELIVHSECMVTEYLNKPEETSSSFIRQDGLTWYRTSDIMSMDDNGNLYFIDRTVDTIKHKGYRVSASEIEAVLQEHPAVIGTCVVGVPDKKVGERIKAYVVLKEDIKGITGYDLIKWCRNNLVAYKVPHYIEFRDMLPKSKVGKLLRREIRDEERRRAGK
jgi:long-chain acyl-CoA synthetase